MLLRPSSDQSSDHRNISNKHQNHEIKAKSYTKSVWSNGLRRIPKKSSPKIKVLIIKLFGKIARTNDPNPKVSISHFRSLQNVKSAKILV